jgi:predicted amidophosphoribosyltransferase
MTSDNSSFPSRLTKIDDLTRKDHHLLEQGDECVFYGEYTAREKWSYSATNKLILNYKKPVDRRGKPEWRYKQDAIKSVTTLLSKSLGSVLGKITLVPVPTSKVKTDAEYDNRIIRTLTAVAPPSGVKLDFRELLLQRTTMKAAHDGGARSIAELESAYIIDEKVVQPTPTWIGLFDDVLTTGCHFKAASNILKKRFPATRITGIFIARRIPEAINFDALFDDIDL